MCWIATTANVMHLCHTVCSECIAMHNRCSSCPGQVPVTTIREQGGRSQLDFSRVGEVGESGSLGARLTILLRPAPASAPLKPTLRSTKTEPTTPNELRPSVSLTSGTPSTVQQPLRSIFLIDGFAAVDTNPHRILIGPAPHTVVHV